MNSVSKLCRITCSAVLGEKMKIVHTLERLSYLVIVIIIINITSGIFVSIFIFLCVHVCEHVCTCSYGGQIRHEMFPSISLGLIFEAGFTTWNSAGLDSMASEPRDPLVSSCKALGLHTVIPCPVFPWAPGLQT